LASAACFRNDPGLFRDPGTVWVSWIRRRPEGCAFVETTADKLAGGAAFKGLRGKDLAPFTRLGRDLVP
jgi:hypothetical protein